MISARRIAPYLAGIAVVLASQAAKAEYEVSLYSGANTAERSDVKIHTPLVSGTYHVKWDGDSFNMPPYWGARATWWLNEAPGFGLALDFTHSKAKANLHDPAIGGSFSVLEFTDGLNTLTANALYRAPISNRLSFYGGAGAGVAVPHVEVSTIPFQGRTFGYQITGPDVQGLIGASVKLGYGISLFTEYKANYSWNHAGLKGGGTLRSNVLTHQFAAGLSYSFGP